MSSVKEHNKGLACKVKETMLKFGYIVKTGHAYELLSVLSGYPNWDTASASEKPLLQSMPLKEKKEINVDQYVKETEQFREGINTLLYEYYQDMGYSAEESIIKMGEFFANIDKSEITEDMWFDLFDCLGVSVRDPFSNFVYETAQECWGLRVKGELDSEKDAILIDILQE